MPNTSDDRATTAETMRDPLAEERTILANERTYSGWVRTALACEGVGLGFHAVMRNSQPAWMPMAILIRAPLASGYMRRHRQANSPGHG